MTKGSTDFWPRVGFLPGSVGQRQDKRSGISNDLITCGRSPQPPMSRIPTGRVTSGFSGPERLFSPMRPEPVNGSPFNSDLSYGLQYE